MWYFARVLNFSADNDVVHFLPNFLIHYCRSRILYLFTLILIWMTFSTFSLSWDFIFQPDVPNLWSFPWAPWSYSLGPCGLASPAVWPWPGFSRNRIFSYHCVISSITKLPFSTLWFRLPIWVFGLAFEALRLCSFICRANQFALGDFASILARPLSLLTQNVSNWEFEFLTDAAPWVWTFLNPNSSCSSSCHLLVVSLGQLSVFPYLIPVMQFSVQIQWLFAETGVLRASALFGTVGSLSVTSMIVPLPKS